MKITILILLISLFIFASCDTYLVDLSELEKPYFISLEEATQPFIDVYGEPEEIGTCNREYESIIIYWYWTKGICINFRCTCYDTIGWHFDYEYRFTPISELEKPYFISLEEATQPYINVYGEPEEIGTCDYECYNTVTYWYWTKGICINFICTCYDTIGWHFYYEYRFTPIS